MSQFFDQASLVMIPSGYKTGKVYSQKPLSADGELTFTRSNDTATRIGPDGFIQRVRTNVVLQSNTFTTSWGLSGTTLTSGQTGYDGLSDAWLLSKDALISRYIFQYLSFSGLKTFSVFAKANTLNNVRLYSTTGTSSTADFSLVDGSLLASANILGSSSEDLGNGWWRFSITTDGTSSLFRIYPDPNGTTAGSIYFQNAQLETGDIATEPILTTTAAVSVGPVANLPRLDYLGSSCGKLLLEPQRTNLALYSESFNNAAWSKSASSVTANDGVSPDGYTNADLITSSGAAGYVFPSSTNVLISAGGATYTYSVYLKAGTASTITVLIGAIANYKGIFDLSAVTATTNTANTTPSIVSVGNGWYRCAIVCTSVASTGYSELQIGRVASGLNFLAYGAQLEASAAYATSYIPTLGAAVTRGADGASKTGISSLLGATEGVVFLEVGDIQNNAVTGAEVWYFEMRKDQNNSFGLASGGSAPQPIRFVTKIAGTAVTETEPAPFANSKIAIKYTSTQFKLFRNGALLYTTNKSIGDYADIEFMEGAGVNLLMVFNQFLVFPTALSDADCIALTA
jgi:hypothetical protein